MFWQVDFDYRQKLSPTDRAWLRDFAERYYGASFAGPDGETGKWTTEQRRERYRSRNSSNRDSYTAEILTDPRPGHESDRVAPEGQDESPTPAYLETTAYKSALRAFRDDPSPENRARLDWLSGRAQE